MKMISTLGAVVALVPFLGIPTPAKTVILFVIGSVIFVRSFLIQRAKKENVSEVFKQNEPISV